MASARAAVLGLAAVLALAGCASSGDKRTELELVQLVHVLPGSYDNRDQVAADRRAGRVAHEAVQLEIVPVDSLMLGDHVFYEQCVTDDAREIVREQRLFAFSVVGKHILQTVWSLKEPRRWLAGRKDPELFTALQPPDVKQLSGCEVIWRVEDGKFKGEGDRQRCRMPAPDGGSAAVETRMELDHDGLDWSERGYDPDGKLLYPHDDDPSVRFRRRAAP